VREAVVICSNVDEQIVQRAIFRRHGSFQVISALRAGLNIESTMRMKPHSWFEKPVRPVSRYLQPSSHWCSLSTSPVRVRRREDSSFLTVRRPPAAGLIKTGPGDRDCLIGTEDPEIARS